MEVKGYYIKKSESDRKEENKKERMKKINKLCYILISLNFGLSSLSIT